MLFSDVAFGRSVHAPSPQGYNSEKQYQGRARVQGLVRQRSNENIHAVSTSFIY